jgi:ArsR family transcriptional regulator, arsenate/arsenite/antimonite-responsive transcriptional repressor
VPVAALAQDSRLAVYRLLVKRGPEGYTPSVLAERLGIAAPTLSFHLRSLQHAGLVSARRAGRFLYYTANFEHMNALVGYLTEHCCSLAESDCDSASCMPLGAGPRRRRA